MTKSATKKLNLKEKVDGEKMDLSLSDLTQLPAKEIAAFKRANQLDLSNNRIVTIGPEVAMLAHLVVLDLSRNQIAKLSGEIGQLVNLRHLDLYNNRLDHLPIEMGKLSKLRYLDVKNNPLKSGVLRIVGHCGSEQECRTAAKQLVKFYADMEIQIHEEIKQRREMQKQQAKEKYAAIQAAAATNEKSESKSVKPNSKKLLNGDHKAAAGDEANAASADCAADDAVSAEADGSGGEEPLTEREKSFIKYCESYPPPHVVRNRKYEVLFMLSFMVLSVAVPMALFRYNGISYLVSFFDWLRGLQ